MKSPTNEEKTKRVRLSDLKMIYIVGPGLINIPTDLKSPYSI